MNTPLPEPRYLNLEYWFTLTVNAFVAFWGLFYDLVYWIERHSLRNLSYLFSFVFFFGIIYVLYRLYLLRRQGIEDFTNIYAIENRPEQRKGRWGEIMNHLNTEHQAEWKVAILEADTLMDEILAKSGYHGENLGERLKGIEPNDFASLQNVWEAHKIRNLIAHEPNYPLLKTEAKEALAKFETALKELKYL